MSVSITTRPSKGVRSRRNRAARKRGNVTTSASAVGSSSHPIYIRSAEPFLGGQAIDSMEFPSKDKFSSKVYNIIQSSETVGNFTTSSTVTTFPVFNFKFSDLDQQASLAAVFDQYRLMMVEYSAFPIGVNFENSQGLLTSVVDYDDSVALTSVPSALDYVNALTVPVGTVVKRTFTPHAAVAMYAGAFSSFGNVTRPWIDCSYPAVQHYGMKFAVGVTTVAVTYQAVARYWFQFRNIR